MVDERLEHQESLYGRKQELKVEIQRNDELEELGSYETRYKRRRVKTCVKKYNQIITTRMDKNKKNVLHIICTLA